MYREVDIKEAIIAALDGKTVFGLNPVSPQDIYNLTDQIATLVQDGDRFIVDEPELEPAEVAPTQEVKEPEATETKKPKKERGKPGPKTKPVDIGKIHALADAGWSQGAIASEMHLSVSTIHKYLTGVDLTSKEDGE